MRNRWMLLGLVGYLFVGIWGCRDGRDDMGRGVVVVAEEVSDVSGGKDVGVNEVWSGDIDTRCEGNLCEEVGDSGLSSCDMAVDLGVLFDGQGVEVAIDLSEEVSWLKTQCSVDGASSEAVFYLRVDVPMRLNFEVLSIEHFDVVMELRAGNCDDDEAVQFCSNSALQDFVAEAGVDYYLIVEARRGVEVPPFTLKVEASGAVCAPAGGWRCEGNARVQCFGGVEERVFECAGGCEAGLCRGDSCENALVVRQSATFVGETAGYHNVFDFSEQPSCSSSGTTGMRTSGQDIVFLLPELRAGQTVFVDAATGDTNDNVILVLNTCDATLGCVAASSSGNQLRWDVEHSGDYYVVIDKTTATARDFHYRIEINP